MEPFGYGLSDITESERTVENINRKVYNALEVLGIDSCTLLAHSISDVYDLNVVHAYHERINAVIARDNTVYDEELSEALTMKQDYMLQITQSFYSLIDTFDSVDKYEDAVASEPQMYGAEFPDVIGYIYRRESKRIL